MSAFHAMPGHLIRRLHQISTSVFADRMEAMGFDFTPIQFAVLACIADEPGVDQATLAGRVACDRVTTGGVLDRLETKGLVSRQVSPKDRRARQLGLTTKGRDMLARVTPVVAELQNDMLVGLNPEERDTLVKLLAKVTENGNRLSRAPLEQRKAG